MNTTTDPVLDAESFRCRVEALVGEYAAFWRGSEPDPRIRAEMPQHAWLSDPVLMEQSRVARASMMTGARHAPETDPELVDYLTEQFDATGGDGHSDPLAWLAWLLAQPGQWDLFADNNHAEPMQGFYWSVWANIDLPDFALLYLRDAETGVLSVETIPGPNTLL